MDELKRWAITVSSVAIFSGVLLTLIPGEKLKSAYKTLISILLVYVLMLPFISSYSFDFSIRDFLKENYAIKDDLDKYSLRNTVLSAQKAVSQVLEDYFASENMQCDFDVECILEDNEIKVEKILARSEMSKDKIINEICKLGFSEEIIEFIGEADDQ